MAAADPAQLIQLQSVFESVVKVAISLAGVAVVVMFFGWWIWIFDSRW